MEAALVVHWVALVVSVATAVVHWVVVMTACLDTTGRPRRTSHRWDRRMG